MIPWGNTQYILWLSDPGKGSLPKSKNNSFQFLTCNRKKSKKVLFFFVVEHNLNAEEGPSTIKYYTERMMFLSCLRPDLHEIWHEGGPNWWAYWGELTSSYDVSVPRSTRSAQTVSTLSHFLNGPFTMAVYTPFTPFYTTLFTLLLPWYSIEDLRSTAQILWKLHMKCKWAWK